MRAFYSEVKDNKTGHSMVLSECSYNMAMNWLSRELAKYGGEIYRTETNISGLVYIWTGIYKKDKWGRVKCTAKRMFYYDEERGYLLGE